MVRSFSFFNTWDKLKKHIESSSSKYIHYLYVDGYDVDRGWYLIEESEVASDEP